MIKNSFSNNVRIVKLFSFFEKEFYNSKKNIFPSFTFNEEKELIDSFFNKNAIPCITVYKTTNGSFYSNDKFFTLFYRIFEKDSVWFFNIKNRQFETSSSSNSQFQERISDLKNTIYCFKNKNKWLEAGLSEDDLEYLSSFLMILFDTPIIIQETTLKSEEIKIF